MLPAGKAGAAYRVEHVYWGNADVQHDPDLRFKFRIGETHGSNASLGQIMRQPFRSELWPCWRLLVSGPRELLGMATEAARLVPFQALSLLEYNSNNTPISCICRPYSYKELTLLLIRVVSKQYFYAAGYI